uniref:TGB1 n=1 Tax=Caper carlavirus 1 TaxID=2794419 RepID=A0A7T5UEZ8_9VIRU|nr:TGB1 [Caper carlavirus 1]
MEVVYDILRVYCERTCKPLAKPVVVCCVPGFGKTTVIRTIITRVHCNVVNGAGVHSDRSKAITYARGVNREVELNILDEFQEYRGDFGVFDVIFGDPEQAELVRRQGLPEPHYVGHLSHRFGVTTANLLRSIGYTITAATSEDTVQFEDPYVSDSVGQVVIFQTGVARSLSKHSIPYKTVAEVRGLEFDNVSVYVEYPICSCELHLLYVALTRHRTRLLVFQLNANPTTRQSFQEHICSISGSCCGDCHKSTSITHLTSWWRSISQTALRWFV